jgi:hypothetical protein
MIQAQDLLTKNMTLPLSMTHKRTAYCPVPYNIPFKILFFIFVKFMSLLTKQNPKPKPTLKMFNTAHAYRAELPRQPSPPPPSPFFSSC